MKTMNLGKDQGFTESKVAYLCMIYIGANEVGSWEQCASASGLSPHDAERIAEVARLFDMMHGLTYHLANDTFGSNVNPPDSLKGAGHTIYQRACIACQELGIDLKKLVIFWNTKLRLIDGGFLATRFAVEG